MTHKRSSPFLARGLSEALRRAADFGRKEGTSGAASIGLLESSVALEKSAATLMTTQTLYLASWLHTPQPTEIFSLPRFIRWLDSYRAWLEAALAYQSATYRRWQCILTHEDLRRNARTTHFSPECLAREQANATASAFGLLASTYSFFSFWLVRLNTEKAMSADIERLELLLLVCLQQGEELLRLLSRKREEWSGEEKRKVLASDDLQQKQRAFRKALGEWGAVWRSQPLFSVEGSRRMNIVIRRLAEYGQDSRMTNPPIQTAPPAKRPWLHNEVVPGSKKKESDHRR